MRVDEVILHFLEGENEGVEIKLTPPREIYIGRSEESDVFLGEKKISRKHCTIHVTDDQVRIVDLESTNGSFVNSKKISEAELKNGDKIKVGSSVIKVEIQTKSGAASESPTGPKIKEKSNPKVPPKKNVPEKPREKEKPKEKVVERDLEKLEDLDEDSLDSPDMEELEDLDEDSKEAPLKKNFEEDSDLVVEYQTSVKETKKIKEYDTSEKIQSVDSKEVEENAESDPFEELDLDVEEESEPELKPEKKPEANEASFDDIPDLDQMEEEEEEELDLSLDQEAPQVKSIKPLMGDLSSMGLSDLLQNLNQNRKTGVLTLKAGTVSGKILMREGQLLASESGKAIGLKAMFRMLTWKDGDFKFQPVAVDSEELKTSQNPIAESIETILMDGFRQYDELRKIQKVLPPIEEELALEDQLEVPISKLHPKVLDVVQLIINHKKMRTVLDLSPLSDLETSKIIFYLIKKKVIRIKK